MEFVEHSAAAEKPDEAPQERPSGQPKAEQESSVIEALPPAGDASIAAEREPVEDTYFDDAVFLGDSRTEGFHLYSGLKTGTYLYATGATVESVFSKSVSTPLGRMPLLDALEKTACGKIYVMLGINGLKGLGADKTVELYRDLVQHLKETHPDSIIYVQSFMPINEQKFEANYGYNLTNAEIDECNEKLMAMAGEEQVYYVDVASAIKDETGGLPAEFTTDGLHFKGEYYNKWIDYLKEHTVPET